MAPLDGCRSTRCPAGAFLEHGQPFDGEVAIVGEWPIAIPDDNDDFAAWAPSKSPLDSSPQPAMRMAVH
jgi:hypothetical protein